MMNNFFISLALALLSITSFANLERPIGIIQPTQEYLLSISNDIAKSRYDNAKTKLNSNIPKTITEELWHNYYNALLLLINNDYSEAFSLLSSNVELEKYGAINTDDGKRVLIQSLKKIGYIYRVNDLLENAISIHKKQLEYSIVFGSYEELHDTTISLDNDYYLAGNFQESINWLLVGIEYAEHIKTKTTKLHALGVSYNNLSLTKAELEEYKESYKYSNLSMKFYKMLDSEVNSTESHTTFLNSVKLNIKILTDWNENLPQNSDQLEVNQKELVLLKHLLN